MAREKRKISNAFVEYQEFIIGHPNFETLPNKRNAKGEITWVRQGDSARAIWWDGLKSDLALPNRASVARAIHPKELNGQKPCQVCGKKLSINAIYPNAKTLKKIGQAFPALTFSHFEEDIFTITNEVGKNYDEAGLGKLAAIFDLNYKSVPTDEFIAKILTKEKSFSPGVMSNAPDRLDGFHTYNACCRASQDTGRHASNLARYSTDRRAYENWAEGDWRGADRLMGLYKKDSRKVECPRCGLVKKMTPDHIGPISLGFMHRMEFQPMCGDCNSSKNNRWSYVDVMKLVQTEAQGTPVISWHSEAMWEAIKPLIMDDATAIRASVLLRRNMHHVLVLFSMIHEAGFDEFLGSYLHPEYAFFDYDFEHFDPSTGFFKVTKKVVKSKNTQKQAERYLRVSFETLETYVEASNRNSKKWTDSECDRILGQVLSQLSRGFDEQAKAGIIEILERLADQAVNEF